MTDEEPDARAVNAEPWEPLPGMVKRQCGQCRYFFATPEAMPAALCPVPKYWRARTEEARTLADAHGVMRPTS